MDGMKDEDKSSRANGFDETSLVEVVVAVFIHGEIMRIPKLDVGDVMGLDLDSVFHVAVAAPALEFEHFRGGNAVHVVYKFAGVGRNVRQNIVEGAGAELKRRRGRFVQVERKKRIEGRGIE